MEQYKSLRIGVTLRSVIDMYDVLESTVLYLIFELDLKLTYDTQHVPLDNATLYVCISL